MRTVDPHTSGLCLVACGWLAACTASGADVQPPQDTIFFPTGLAIAPDDSVLFVSNANSELRYDSGSVSVVDLNVVDQVIDAWLTDHTIASACKSADGTPGRGDPDFTETLDCEDETQFMRQGAGARIGNFATDVAVQDTGTGALRLIVPTRGDPSVAWINWDGNTLSCNTNAEGFALCDDTHRLTYVHNDPALAALPDEPFNAFADKNFAVVTHLTTGAVTLIDSPPDGDAVIADVAFGLFQPDMITGLRGSTGVVGRTPNISPDEDIVYIGSRSEDRIQTITVGRPVNNALPYIVPGNWFFLDSVGGNSGGSVDTRGMRFSPDGDRLFVLNRRPPSIQVFDTSLGPTGFPQNRPIGASDVCRQASTLTVQDSGDGVRAYLTCFQDGQIYVVDPRGQSDVEDIITVGRGPYAIAGATTRKRLYVTNFLEDTIAVIDVAPGSATRDRVVLRIGEIRPP